jgi:hypothetical protein
MLYQGNSQRNDQLSVSRRWFVYLYTGELYGDKSGHSAFPRIAGSVYACRRWGHQKSCGKTNARTAAVIH